MKFELRQFVPRMQLFNLPYDPNGGYDGGGGGSGGTGGGGTPGTPSAGVTGIPAGENGGVRAGYYVLLVPAIDSRSGVAYFGFYDVLNFNDDNDGSYYAYRVEDIDTNRVPTVRRIGLNYVDIGQATITVTLTATNDDQVVISKSKTINIGTVGATGKYMTKFVDVALTGFQPQVTISRAANGGPVNIISMTMYGEVEDATL